MQLHALTLSKIGSHYNSVQDYSANTVKCEHILSYSKCSKCLPLDFTYTFSTFFKRGTPLFCGKCSRVFSNATFNSVIVFGFGWSFQKSFVHRSPNMISADGSSSVTIVSFESFADSSRSGIVEQHVLCVARWICRSILQQSVAVFKKFWKCKLIFFPITLGKTLALKWHYSDIIVVSSWYCFC